MYAVSLGQCKLALLLFTEFVSLFLSFQYTNTPTPNHHILYYLHLCLVQCPRCVAQAKGQGVLHNVQGVLRNVLCVLHNVQSVLANLQSVLRNVGHLDV